MPLSKFSRRHRKTWNDEKPEQEVFLEEHRVPPKPPHYYDRKKGRCRMCGLNIYKIYYITIWVSMTSCK